MKTSLYAGSDAMEYRHKQGQIADVKGSGAFHAGEDLVLRIEANGIIFKNSRHGFIGC